MNLPDRRMETWAYSIKEIKAVNGASRERDEKTSKPTDNRKVWKDCSLRLLKCKRKKVLVCYHKTTECDDRSENSRLQRKRGGRRRKMRGLKHLCPRRHEGTHFH